MDGSHTITATYAGDGSHLGSSGAVEAVAAVRDWSVTGGRTSAPATVGAASSCTATVTDTTPGVATTPTGTVSWTSSNTGTFSATSCTLSGSSTNPITGFVSSSC